MLRFPNDPHAQRIWDELMKLPHGVLVAMYREMAHLQCDDLAELPRWSGTAGHRMPPHTASNDDLAAALAPALVRRDFMRQRGADQALLDAAREGEELSKDGY